MTAVGYMAFLLTPVVSPALEEQPQRSAIVLPTWSAASMSDALARFPPARRYPLCFEMRIEYDRERLVIEFVAIGDRIESDSAVTLNASVCGKGAVFNYRLGRFQKGYFIR